MTSVRFHAQADNTWNTATADILRSSAACECSAPVVLAMDMKALLARYANSKSNPTPAPPPPPVAKPKHPLHDRLQQIK
jgi:hypothetical protein